MSIPICHLHWTPSHPSSPVLIISGASLSDVVRLYSLIWYLPFANQLPHNLDAVGGFITRPFLLQYLFTESQDELTGYLANQAGPVPVVLDLRLAQAKS